MKSTNDINKQFDSYLNLMVDSPLKTYIVERVLGQIAWYDKKSADKQARFKSLSIVAIVLNAIIPVMVLLSDDCVFIKILIAGLSSSAGAISAIVVLCGYKELWIHYRSNCELLVSTLHRFFLRVGEFYQFADDESALKDALVANCEKYFTKEFQTWATVTNAERPVASLKS